MKKLLGLLGTIMITGNAIPSVIAAAPNRKHNIKKRQNNENISTTSKTQDEQQSQFSAISDSEVDIIEKEITLDENYSENIKKILKEFMKNRKIDPLRMINNEGIVRTDYFETQDKRNEREYNIKIIEKLDEILELRKFDANKIRILVLTLKNKENNEIKLIINLDNFYVQGFINNEDQYFYFKEEKSLNEWRQEIKKLTEKLNEWNKINEEIKLLDLKKINNNHHIINKIDEIKENLKKQLGTKENKEKIDLLNKNLFDQIQINNEDSESISKLLNELKENVEKLEKEKIYLGQEKINAYQKIQQIRQKSINLLNKINKTVKLDKKEYEENIKKYQWNNVFNKITSIIESKINTIQHKKIKENKINEEIIKKYSINKNKKHILNYNGSYQNKGLNVVNQNIDITKRNLNNAITNLSFLNKENNQNQITKDDLARVIFITSEAMRFGSHLKHLNYEKDGKQIEFKNIPEDIQNIINSMNDDKIQWKNYSEQLIGGWMAASKYLEQKRKEIFKELSDLIDVGDFFSKNKEIFNKILIELADTNIKTFNNEAYFSKYFTKLFVLFEIIKLEVKIIENLKEYIKNNYILGKYYNKIENLEIKTKNNKKQIKSKKNSIVSIDIFEIIKENQKIIKLNDDDLEIINQINSKAVEHGLIKFMNKNNSEYIEKLIENMTRNKIDNMKKTINSTNEIKSKIEKNKTFLLFIENITIIKIIEKIKKDKKLLKNLSEKFTTEQKQDLENKIQKRIEQSKKELEKEINKKTGDRKIQNKHNNILYNVPSDGSCLFWSVATAYLLPVINNYEEFINRFIKLFGEEKCAYLPYVLALLQQFDLENNLYNQLWYQDQTAINLITNVFRNRVVDYIEENLYTVTTHTGQLTFINLIEENNEIADNYLERMREPSAWGGTPEIIAMSNILNSNISLNNDNPYQPINQNSSNIINLFHVNDRTHYNFGLTREEDQTNHPICIDHNQENAPVVDTTNKPNILPLTNTKSEIKTIKLLVDDHDQHHVILSKNNEDANKGNNITNVITNVQEKTETQLKKDEYYFLDKKTEDNSLKNDKNLEIKLIKNNNKINKNMENLQTTTKNTINKYNSLLKEEKQQKLNEINQHYQSLHENEQKAFKDKLRDVGLGLTSTGISGAGILGISKMTGISPIKGLSTTANYIKNSLSTTRTVVSSETGEAVEMTPLLSESTVSEGLTAAETLSFTEGSAVVATEGAVIGTEAGTAAALAPETLGLSLLIGGLVIAGTAIFWWINSDHKIVKHESHNQYNEIEKYYKFLAHDQLKLDINISEWDKIKQIYQKNSNNYQEFKNKIKSEITNFHKEDHSGWGGSINDEDINTLINIIYNHFEEINNHFLSNPNHGWKIITNTIGNYFIIEEE